jgi:hypothetical protein
MSVSPKGSVNVRVATPLATPLTVNVAKPPDEAAEDVTVATDVLLLVAVIVRLWVETVDTVTVVESSAEITKAPGDGLGDGKVLLTATMSVVF